jgi:hypothetical protein
MISSFLVKLPNFGNQANTFLGILKKLPITFSGFASVAASYKNILCGRMGFGTRAQRLTKQTAKFPAQQFGAIAPNGC